MSDSDNDVDSGPFCRHWADPSDCEVQCVACGHFCKNHRDECQEDDCTCESFVKDDE